MHNTALSCEARLNKDGARSAPTKGPARFVSFSALFDSPLLRADFWNREIATDLEGEKVGYFGMARDSFDHARSRIAPE